LTFCRAAHVVNTLKGQTFGLFGGRSFGMNTATAVPLQWQKIFGVDVEHIDQLEIIRGASQVSHNKVETAFKWLTKNVGRILSTPFKKGWKVLDGNSTGKVYRVSS